jgi:xylan 1,4-beta-xylosidase
MIWHYHDDNVPGPSASVALTIAGLPAERALLHHYRVDQEHSNSYEVWKKMGAPQNPTTEQYTKLEKASQLALLTSPKWVSPRDGSVLVEFELPRQAVSLVVLNWGK